MPKVSIFKNVGEVKNPVNMDFYEYLYKTRDGEWQDITMECRLIKDEKEKKEFKKTMPTTTLSGEFSYRNDKSLVNHSGYLSIDLDNLEDVEKVKKLMCADRNVFACWVSTGGNGLRVLFSIEESKHREAFLAISKYLFDRYELIADPNGINPSKPYIVSFDPYLYINPNENVPVFNKYIKETKIKQIPDFVHTASDFDYVMSQITGRRINICEDYNDWLKIGFALSEQFGENGRKFFHDISEQSSKYKSVVTDKQFNQCLKARGNSRPVGISSFYYLAKMHNVNIVTEQTKTIVRTTKNGKKAGLSKEQIIANLEKFNDITDGNNVVESVYDNDSILDDVEESILFQVEMFISNNYKLRMNEVTGYLEQNGVTLTQSDLNSIYIATKKIVAKLDYQNFLRLLKSDFVESYNPFFEFFNSDGIPVILPSSPVPNVGFNSPLIDKLSCTIKNDNPSFTEFFLRKWMVGMVSAAHKVHSPLLLCLLGGQNTGKTEFFRRLLPKELSGYYAESKLDKEKDDELLMTENLLIMDDELGGKSKQDAQKLKNITSKQYFSLRRPYGDHNEKILRLAVLAGTSNYKEILSDPTGNRRIIPIEVKDIDKDLYNSIDKKELLMEAYDLYKKGFDWRITHKDIEYLNDNQKEYEMIVKEKELIDQYYFPGDEFKMTTTEILVELERLTNQKLNLNTVGRELLNLKYEKKSTRINGVIQKRWGVNKINRFSPSLDNSVTYAKPINKEDLPF